MGKQTASAASAATTASAAGGMESLLPGISLAGTLITTGMSFIDADNQRARQREAEEDAERAMAEARKRLAVNFTDELAIRKEPYELQREALLSQGAMAIQAGAESERGAAPTAGKIQMAQNEAQAGIRTEMGKEMMDIDKQRIAEASRLRDLNAQLDLEEAAGQQLIAQNAEAAAAAAMSQGIEGGISAVQQFVAMPGLFSKSEGEGITTSGADFGPGVNASFQSPIGNRYMYQGNTPLNSVTNNTQKQSPFTSLYPKGYRSGLEYGSEFNDYMPTVNQFTTNPNYYSRKRNTGLGYGIDFSSVGGY